MTSIITISVKPWNNDHKTLPCKNKIPFATLHGNLGDCNPKPHDMTILFQLKPCSVL